MLSKNQPSLRDPLVQAGGLAQAERRGTISAFRPAPSSRFCKRRRSASNSSSVIVRCYAGQGAKNEASPRVTDAGRMNLSQLLALQQLEYSILIGWICAPDFCAKKMMPRPSSICWPARTIRGNQDIVSRSKNFGKFQHGTCPEPRAGAPNNIKTETFRKVRYQISIPARADQTCTGTMRSKSL